MVFAASLHMDAKIAHPEIAPSSEVGPISSDKPQVAPKIAYAQVQGLPATKVSPSSLKDYSRIQAVRILFGAFLFGLKSYRRPYLRIFAENLKNKHKQVFETRRCPPTIIPKLSQHDFEMIPTKRA